MSKELKYKEAVEEIEKIISDMENQEPDIDLLPEKVKRATELIDFCKKKLRGIESELNKNLD